MRGQQEAQQSISGAQVGVGSNAAVTADTEKRAEADALATVIDGIYGSVNKNASAHYAEMASKNTLESGGMAAAASLLAGRTGAMTTLANGAISAYSMNNMWTTKTPTTTTTTSAPPSE